MALPLKDSVSQLPEKVQALQGLAVVSVLLASAGLVVVLQVHKLAQLADLSSATDARSGSVWQFGRNLRAIRRSGWALPVLMVPVFPFILGLGRLGPYLSGQREQRSSVTEVAIDPFGRMSAAAKEQRLHSARIDIVLPAVLYLLLSFLFAAVAMHDKLMSGSSWGPATAAAGAAVVLGFFAKWLQRWLAPLLTGYQFAHVVYLYGHDTALTQLRVPLLRYLDWIWPDWDRLSVYCNGPADPASRCHLSTEFLGFLVLVGFWVLNWGMVQVADQLSGGGPDSGPQAF